MRNRPRVPIPRPIFCRANRPVFQATRRRQDARSEHACGNSNRQRPGSRSADPFGRRPSCGGACAGPLTAAGVDSRLAAPQVARSISQPCTRPSNRDLHRSCVPAAAVSPGLRRFQPCLRLRRSPRRPPFRNRPTRSPSAGNDLVCPAAVRRAVRPGLRRSDEDLAERGSRERRFTHLPRGSVATGRRPARCFRNFAATKSSTSWKRPPWCPSPRPLGLVCPSFQGDAAFRSQSDRAAGRAESGGHRPFCRFSAGALSLP